MTNMLTLDFSAFNRWPNSTKIRQCEILVNYFTERGKSFISTLAGIDLSAAFDVVDVIRF